MTPTACCHLHYDRDHHAATRAQTRETARADAGWQPIPELEAKR